MKKTKVNDSAKTPSQEPKRNAMYCNNVGAMLAPCEVAQFAVTLHTMGLLSDQTLLEVFGYDDQMEIERKRYARSMLKGLGYGLRD